MSESEGKNESNDATFPVGIQKGSQYIEIGEFTYTHTVLDVKKIYQSTISNKNTVDQLIFYHMGQPMENDKKLEYYDDDVKHTMTIVLTFSCFGGSTVDYHNMVDDSKITTNETNTGAITDSNNSPSISEQNPNNGDQEYNDDNKPKSNELIQSTQDQGHLKDSRNNVNDTSMLEYISNSASCLKDGASYGASRLKDGALYLKDGAVAMLKKVERDPNDLESIEMKQVPKGNNTNQRKTETKEQNRDVISKKPIGLSNLGNTCYFNSALQCLMAIPQLNKYIINLNKYPNYGIISSLKKLYQGNDWDNDALANIIEKCATMDPNIGSGRQYDSVITFNIMLTLIDKELMGNGYTRIAKNKDYEVVQPNTDNSDCKADDLYENMISQSKIRELIYGIKAQQHTCLKCNTISKEYVPFGSFELPSTYSTIEIDVRILVNVKKVGQVWLQNPEDLKIKICSKSKIKILKERILNKYKDGNFNENYDVSIFSFNKSNEVSKWITYYEDDNFCEELDNENFIYAQINIKNDPRININCFDIFCYAKNRSQIRFTIWKRINGNTDGKKLYKRFDKKGGFKLCLFDNDSNLIRDECKVELTNKSVLMFLWTKDTKCEDGSWNGSTKCTKGTPEEINRLSEVIPKIQYVYKLRDAVLSKRKVTNRVKFNTMKANSVNECLKIFEESIPVNGIKCEGCKKKSLAVDKQISALKTPKVLVLSFNREVFNDPGSKQYNGYGSQKKGFDSTNIKYPINDLEFKDATYNLFAISVHSGYSTSFGHYVSYVRRGKASWYECNDEHTSRIKLNIHNKLQSDSAKLLVYIKNENKQL